jgi:hypothetical protein
MEEMIESAATKMKEQSRRIVESLIDPMTKADIANTTGLNLVKKGQRKLMKQIKKLDGRLDERKKITNGNKRWNG